MAKRPPYYKKSKAIKDKENYEATTDFTSQDVFYTTESNATQREYNYTNRPEKDYDDYTTDTYDSRYFQKYDTKQRRSDDSQMYDDYTTSVQSYEEPRRKSRPPTTPQSKSEYMHSRKPSPRRNHGHRSPREYDYFTPDESRGKKRSKLTRSPEKRDQYDLENDSEKYREKQRKSHSPKRGNDYKKYTYEELEEEFDYEKYFEPTTSRKRSPEKHMKRDRSDEIDRRQKKKRSNTSRKEQDYQVFAYHEPKDHEGVFKGNKNLSATPLPSEKEVRIHEYPVLAFKDNTPGDIGSDMVYVPVLVLDKKSDKSRTQKSAGETKPQGFQVFAANLQDQQNIFQTLGGVPSKNAREGSYSNNLSDNQAQKGSVPEHKPKTDSSLKYPASLMGSLFDVAKFSPKPTKEKVSKETKSSQQNTFKMSKEKFIYQVNVDIVPSSQNVFGGKRLNEEPANTAEQFEYKEIADDTLHDDYPVTKDYIKVNNISDQERKSMIAEHISEATRKSMIAEHISEATRKSTMNKSIASPAGKSYLTGEKSKSIYDSMAMQSTKSNIRKTLPELSNEDVVSGRKFGSQRQSMGIASKQGSMAIASHIQNDAEISVKGTSGVTRLNGVNEEIIQNQATRASAATNRKSVSQRPSHRAISKEQSIERKSWIGTTPSQEIQVARASVATNRKSVVSQRPLTHAISKEKSGERKSMIGSPVEAVPSHEIEVTRPSVATNRKSVVSHRPLTKAISKEQSVGRKSRVEPSVGAVSSHELEVTRPSVATNRKSVVSHRPLTKAISKEQSVGRKSRVEPSVGAVPSQELEVTRPSVATNRKSVVSQRLLTQAISEGQSVGRKSRVEPSVGAVSSQELEVTRPSVATNRKSVVPQRPPSEATMSRMETNIQKSRASAMSTPPHLQKQLTITSQARPSHLQSIAHGSPEGEDIQEDLRKFTKEADQEDNVKHSTKAPSAVTRKSAVTPIVYSGQRTESVKKGSPTLDKAYSKEALQQFKNEIFQKDSDELQSHKERKSTFKGRMSVKQAESSGRFPALITDVDRELQNETTVGLVPSHMADHSNKTASKAQAVADVYHEQSDFEDIGLGEYLHGEKVTSVIDFTGAEQPHSESHLIPLKKSKSKKSIKSFASSLVQFGRRKSQVSANPVLEVFPDNTTATIRSVGKTKSHGNEHEDNQSLFIESIEPTSTLYRNEAERTHTIVSNRYEKPKESKHISVKSKSGDKLPIAGEKQPKRGLSRLFSRSKSRETNHKVEGKKSKSKLKKVKSWGILRKSKSKSAVEKGSTHSMVSRYEEPQSPPSPPPQLPPPQYSYVPMEGPDHIEEEEKSVKEQRKEPVKKEDKPCNCVADYVSMGRECSHFFLGTTLHEQVMNILTVF